MKKIVFTVTNDLSYDQRMIRICTSLAGEGYKVVLTGRKLKSSLPLELQPYQQKRIACFFTKGFLFYAEYNLRLFFYLLTQGMHCICAIDLDTILACYFATLFKPVHRVYDAHELFCEMKEVANRPVVYSIWKAFEKFSVPKFRHGYTVNEPIAREFKRMYGVNYAVIRSITVLSRIEIPRKADKYILYQGSVNEGRSFETLIPAMQYVNCRLIICGDGNFMKQTKTIVKEHNLEHKVIFKGQVKPQELHQFTLHATLGITLFENNGLSNYLSLANRFFDYIHGAIPQVCVKYPAYEEINNKYEVAVLIEDLSAENIAANCNLLLNDESLYRNIQQNCLKARQVYNWQNEEKKLFSFYKTILS